MLRDLKYEWADGGVVREWSQEEEIWKEIKDWEGLYEVSNHGRVRNMKRGNILSIQENNQVSLRSKGRVKHKLVHYAMMEVFCPVKEEKEYEKTPRPRVPKSVFIERGYDPLLFYHRRNWWWECVLKREYSH